MKLKIITLPDPILRRVSKPVETVDRKVKQLVHRMAKTLQSGPEGEEIGVGLSAVQVGKLHRIFLAKIDENKPFRVFINPEIISSGRLIKKPRWMEGCLSVPLFYAHIQRHRQVSLTYRDIDGIRHKETFRGFPATVIQHELDHLNGTLFIDHLLQQGGDLYKLSPTVKGEEMIRTELASLPPT